MITPPHPHLRLKRPLTREEMIEALRYEGMFGFGKDDEKMAQQLANEGLVEIGSVKGQPVVVNLMDDPK